MSSLQSRLTSILGLGLQGNYSLFGVPAAWVIAMWPGFYALQVFNKNRFPGEAEYDLTNPDANAHRKSALPADKYVLSLRARNAHSNALINLPFFASAIALGNVIGLSTTVLNGAAVSYVALRGLYVYFYLKGDTNDQAVRRSLTWTASNVVSLALFVVAGFKLKDRI